MVVLLVVLEVGGEVLDAISKQGDLDLGGTGVVLAFGEFLDGLALGRKIGSWFAHDGITLDIDG